MAHTTTTKRVRELKQGDRILCLHTRQEEQVIFARASVKGFRLVRTNHHDHLLRLNAKVEQVVCAICGKARPLPVELPIDPPFFSGGRCCTQCDEWLRTGELEES